VLRSAARAALDLCTTTLTKTCTGPTHTTHHKIQGLRRFIGKHQLNTIFAIRAASLVWLQATAVLQTDLTKTA